MPPLGVAWLAAFAAPGAILFSLLHGGDNGLLTIARETLPLALFGAQGYGLRVDVRAARAARAGSMSTSNAGC